MRQTFLRNLVIIWLLTGCTHGTYHFYYPRTKLTKAIQIPNTTGLYAAFFLVVSSRLQAQDTIPFLKNRPSCLPIVQLKLNGQIAYFLLDSGSEITVLNSSVKKRFNFIVKESSGESNNIDWSGNSIEVKDVLSATLEVGSTIITTGLRTADLDLLLRQVGSRTCVNVVGILGSDILRRAALVVDYSHNMLRH